MNKEKENIQLVPKFRFNEFVEDGEWNNDLLEKLSFKISDGIHSTPKYDNTGEYYFVNGNNLIDGRIIINENTKKVSKDEFKKHKRELGSNTILLSINGTIGNLSEYNNEKVVLGKSACYININEKKVNKKFILFTLKTERTTSYFTSELTGSTIKNLSLKTIKNTVILLPTNPKEQQKIANTLSSLDDYIKAETEKLSLLKDHKKGLLQQLFPANGERVPKKRFPEFVNDGDWEGIELNSFCFNISSGKDKSIDGGEFDLYGSTGIIGRTENSSYNGAFILVARVGANAGLINKVNGQFGVTDNTLVINLKKPQIIDFIFYSLAKIGLNKLVFGSGQPLITGKQLKKLNILTPENSKEQKKIANTLTAVDELIEAQTIKIDNLQTHKKGLMQGLFPNINNVAL